MCKRRSHVSDMPTAAATPRSAPWMGLALGADILCIPVRVPPHRQGAAMACATQPGAGKGEGVVEGLTGRVVWVVCGDGGGGVCLFCSPPAVGFAQVVYAASCLATAG